MNSGERDELLIKLHLVLMRDNGQTLNGIPIRSVGFGNYEYKSIPKNVSNNIDTLDDYHLSELSRMLGITKAGVFDKSDVYINGKGYSLKSFSAAPPALVNHTARPGFENACRCAGVNIAQLDRLIDHYWNLRSNGIIGEDIKNTDSKSPFKDSKNILKPILNYFLFAGSGKGLSNFPAEYILDYVRPNNPNTWHILDRNSAVDEIWSKLIFSVRAKKGMPANYDKETYSKPNAESIGRWTQYHSGDYRGALHIRMHK